MNYRSEAVTENQSNKMGQAATGAQIIYRSEAVTEETT